MDYLNKKVKVIVDRPLASKHPEHEIYYKKEPRIS